MRFITEHQKTQHVAWESIYLKAQVIDLQRQIDELKEAREKHGRMINNHAAHINTLHRIKRDRANYFHD